MKKIFDNIGSSMVLTIISFTAILGIVALVTDIGTTLYERQKLWNAVDAAALAGAQNLQKDITLIKKSAKDYALSNGVELQDINIVIPEDKKSIEINANKNVQYFFARVLGVKEKTVYIKSVAKIAPITSVVGIRPLAIAEQQFVYGEQYILKEGAGDGLSGNYGILSLGGNGADIVENNLLNGYSGKINVGDSFYTETGNVTQITRRAIEQLIAEDPHSTYNSFSQESSRLIKIPVINTLDVSGKKPVTIVGFAAFYLEEIRQSGGHSEIVGRFVKHVTYGDSSEGQTDYGLKGIKLVK